MILETIVFIRDFLTQANKDYNFNKGQVSEYDKAVINVTHEMEFEDSYDKRSKISTKMHSILVDRRVAKDNVYILQPIAELLNNPKYINLLNDLSATIGEIRRRKDSLSSRHYNPRNAMIQADKVKSLNAMLRNYRKDRKELLR